MSKINFEFRVDCAHRYHSFLSSSMEYSWVDLFNKVENESKYGLPELLTLIHPRWHSELGFTNVSDPRGANTFNANNRFAKCRSSEIWGYQCPYLNSIIHIDHTFPFARGGSTTQDNAMYLCSEHNLSKSTDLHLIPWESLISQGWIGTQLRVFINFAQRQTDRTLYFPERQLGII
jgi:hypothetical protein